jgi:hypothetical protein
VQTCNPRQCQRKEKKRKDPPETTEELPLPIFPQNPTTLQQCKDQIKSLKEELTKQQLIEAASLVKQKVCSDNIQKCKDELNKCEENPCSEKLQQCQQKKPPTTDQPTTTGEPTTTTNTGDPTTSTNTVTNTDNPTNNGGTGGTGGTTDGQPGGTNDGGTGGTGGTTDGQPGGTNDGGTGGTGGTTDGQPGGTNNGGTGGTGGTTDGQTSGTSDGAKQAVINKCDKIDFSNQPSYCNVPDEEKLIIRLGKDGDLDCNECLRKDLYGPAAEKCIYIFPPERSIRYLAGEKCDRRANWDQIRAADATRTPKITFPAGYSWTDRAPHYECTEKDKAEAWWWRQPESASTYLRMNGNAGITQKVVDDIKAKYGLTVDPNKGTSQLNWVYHVKNPNPPSDWQAPSDWNIWFANFERDHPGYADK